MDNIQKYGTMAVSSFAANVADKSFMQGLANFMEAVTAPDKNLAKFLSSYANAIVPSGVAEVAQLVDPVEREFVSFMDRIQARTPIWSKQLPEKYDLMGQTQERGLLETVTGVQTKTTNGLLAALEKSGIDIKPSQIGRAHV